MRKIYLIAAIALVCMACEELRPLPEPELPVIDIEFTNAKYQLTTDNTDPLNPVETHSITLTCSALLEYTIMYRFYNKSEDFSVGHYLKNKDINVISTTIPDNQHIKFIFKPKGSIPVELQFLTKEPLYYGSAKNTVWGFAVVEAKGFIKTDKLSVTP